MCKGETMIAWLLSKKIPWYVSIPVGLMLDLAIAIVLTEFIRSFL